MLYSTHDGRLKHSFASFKDDIILFVRCMPLNKRAERWHPQTADFKWCMVHEIEEQEFVQNSLRNFTWKWLVVSSDIIKAESKFGCCTWTLPLIILFSEYPLKSSCINIPSTDSPSLQITVPLASRVGNSLWNFWAANLKNAYCKSCPDIFFKNNWVTCNFSTCQYSRV